MMNRTMAYRNLRRWMHKEYDEAHIANFTKRECVTLINKLTDYGIVDPLQKPKTR